MNSFWENILRYPRFFISSVTGLFIIILNPIIKFFKKGKISALIAGGAIFISVNIIILIVNEMLNI